MRGGPFTAGRYVRTRGAIRRFMTSQRGGFTVIEVLIVLAISGGLFVSAVLMISGRQNKTAFDQSIRQVQSQVQQILNEVSTGYFPSNSNFVCNAAGSGLPPVLSSGSAGQGSNSACIFVGKAIQFKLAGTDPERFVVYTIAGLKQGGAGGGESSSLADAKPIVVAPSSAAQASSGYPDISSEQRLQNGLMVARVWYRDSAGADHDIGAIAFVNGLAQYGSGGQLISGSGSVSIVAADNGAGTTGLGISKTDMAQALNSGGGNKLATGALNPTGGVFICLEDGGEDYAIVRIGGESRDLAVTLTVKDKTGSTCTD